MGIGFAALGHDSSDIIGLLGGFKSVLKELKVRFVFGVVMNLYGCVSATVLIHVQV